MDIREAIARQPQQSHNYNEGAAHIENPENCNFYIGKDISADNMKGQKRKDSPDLR